MLSHSTLIVPPILATRNHPCRVWFSTFFFFFFCNSCMSGFLQTQMWQVRYSHPSEVHLPSVSQLTSARGLEAPEDSLCCKRTLVFPSRGSKPSPQRDRAAPVVTCFIFLIWLWLSIKGSMWWCRSSPQGQASSINSLLCDGSEEE